MSTADFKDRQFLAVIGDEVHYLANPHIGSSYLMHI